MAEPMPIFVKRFWTEYIIPTERNMRLQVFADQGKPGYRWVGDGEAKRIEVDKVEYGPVGLANSQSTVATVYSLSCVAQQITGGINEAIALAEARWAVIKPQWEAWRSNQDVPINGTPLAAWAGVTPEQADVLRSVGLRSIEEVANLTDAIITKVPLPNVRDLVANAKIYLDSVAGIKIAEDVKAVQAENAELRAQLEEMKQIMLAQQDGAAPKRRGRPKKTETQEAAA